MAKAVVNGQVKAKELKAEKVAERERVKKETETEEKDSGTKVSKPKVRRVKFDSAGKKIIKPVKKSDSAVENVKVAEKDKAVVEKPEENTVAENKVEKKK